MLHYLMLNDEVATDYSSSAYPALLSEEQIQKVIFDTSYMAFIKSRPLSKTQNIQYECVKVELKDDYLRKVKHVNSLI